MESLKTEQIFRVELLLCMYIKHKLILSGPQKITGFRFIESPSNSYHYNTCTIINLKLIMFIKYFVSIICDLIRPLRFQYTRPGFDQVPV